MKITFPGTTLCFLMFCSTAASSKEQARPPEPAGSEDRPGLMIHTQWIALPQADANRLLQPRPGAGENLLQQKPSQYGFPRVPGVTLYLHPGQAAGRPTLETAALPNLLHSRRPPAGWPPR